MTTNVTIKQEQTSPTSDESKEDKNLNFTSSVLLNEGDNQDECDVNNSVNDDDESSVASSIGSQEEEEIRPADNDNKNANKIPFYNLCNIMENCHNRKRNRKGVKVTQADLVEYILPKKVCCCILKLPKNLHQTLIFCL